MTDKKLSDTEKGSCEAKDRDKPHSTLLNVVAVSKKCRPSDIPESKKLFLVLDHGGNFFYDFVTKTETLTRIIEKIELTPELEEKITLDALNVLIRKQHTKTGRYELKKFYEDHKIIISFTIKEVFQKLHEAVEGEGEGRYAVSPSKKLKESVENV